MSDLKQWQCGCGVTLGYMRKNGDGLTQLMLLRQPLDMTAERPAEVDLLGPVTGRVSVKCSCGKNKLWDVTVEAMLALFEGLNDKQAFEFWIRLLERARTPLSPGATSPQMPLRGHLGGDAEGGL